MYGYGEEPSFDSFAIWLLVGGLIAVVVKGGFWVLMYFGFMRQFGAAQSQVNQFNPLAALLGIPQQPIESAGERLERHRLNQAARYRMSGLWLGLTAIILGTVMVFFGYDEQGDTSAKLLGVFSVDRAGPGVILMMVGAAIIKFTAHAKHD